jgi:hypothetical protein
LHVFPANISVSYPEKAAKTVDILGCNQQDGAILFVTTVSRTAIAEIHFRSLLSSFSEPVIQLGRVVQRKVINEFLAACCRNVSQGGGLILHRRLQEAPN